MNQLPHILRDLQRVQHLTALMAWLLAACLAAAGAGIGYALHQAWRSEPLAFQPQQKRSHHKPVADAEPKLTQSAQADPTESPDTEPFPSPASEKRANQSMVIFQYSQELMLWNALADWLGEPHGELKSCLIAPIRQPSSPTSSPISSPTTKPNRQSGQSAPRAESGRWIVEARCERLPNHSQQNPALAGQVSNSYAVQQRQQNGMVENSKPPERWQDRLRDLNLFNLGRHENVNPNSSRHGRNGWAADQDASLSDEASLQKIPASGWIELESAETATHQSRLRQQYNAQQDRWQTVVPKP